MSSRVTLPDGSSWPRPALGYDEDGDIGWRCRYSPDSITRQDLMRLAGIVDAYGILVAESTQKRRDYVCRELRAALGGSV
jgi:hypothetical protein